MINDQLILRILYYTPICNLIKDFAGPLSEYPLYFITKQTPRIWGYKWWNHSWIIPSFSKKVERIVVIQDSVTDHNSDQTFTKMGYILPVMKFFDRGFCLKSNRRCFYDLFQNAWPSGVHHVDQLKHFSSTPKEKEKEKGSLVSELTKQEKTKGKKTKSNPTIMHGYPFYVKPICFSIAKVLSDADERKGITEWQCFAYNEAAKNLYDSKDFPFTLACWYNETLPMLANRSMNLKKTLQRRFNQVENLEEITLNQINQISSTFFDECPWLAYHFNLLSFYEWNQKACIDSKYCPWNCLETLFSHQLYATLVRLFREWASHFNYVTDEIDWKQQNNWLSIKDIQFFWEHFPLDWQNVRMNFVEASPHVFEFFIGKIRAGLITYYFPNFTFTKINQLQSQLFQSQSQQNYWYTLFLENVWDDEQQLLWKAWRYFYPSEKELFLNQSFFSIRKLESLQGETLHFKNFSLLLNDEKENQNKNLYTFFQTLLEQDTFIELIFQSETKRNELLQQFLTCAKQNEKQKASSYLYLLIYTEIPNLEMNRIGYD